MSNAQRSGLWWAVALISTNVLTNLGSGVLQHLGWTAPAVEQAEANNRTQRICCLGQRIAELELEQCHERHAKRDLRQ